MAASKWLCLKRRIRSVNPSAMRKSLVGIIAFARPSCVGADNISIAATVSYTHLVLSLAILVSVSGCGEEDSSSGRTSDSSVADQSNKAGKVGDTVSNDKWALTVQSAKVFDELKGDLTTETPDEGNVYLVLFCEVENKTDKDDYFNYFYLDSYVDGYSTSFEITLTKPDGYSTLTGDVAAGKKLKGALVWQVSKEWKEFETRCV